MALERHTQRIDTFVTFSNSQQISCRGTLIHISRNQVVFEIYNPYSIVQLSEVLSEFRVLRGERMVYTGRAVVSNLVSTGLMLIVSATLVDPWQDIVGLPPGDELEREVREFVEDWERSHGLLPEYQLSVSHIAGFLSELSRWLNQLEAETNTGIRQGSDAEKELVATLQHGLTTKIFDLFGRFEQVALNVPSEQVVSHRAFAQRELHPLMLAAPFVHRTFTKPLGYAGDYEMVNMILRDPIEGPNTYARIVNAFVLSREPAEAHRNRIDFLVDLLRKHASRARMEKRKFTVLNIGCGPARETERFMREDALCEYAEFTMLDFNDETLAYAKSRLTAAARESGRKCPIEFMHKSVHDLLKESSRTQKVNAVVERRWDLVFCAGLFDYLSDRICKKLLQLFYEWTQPGGQTAVTNVHSRNPIRQFMEHILEWHLIYRDDSDFKSLVPAEWNPVISSDVTGVNVYMTIDKPGATGA
jgi:extracellular factor (EF) 3-hydroxypalmitic acid methyl ester biosynthesis protein